MLVAKCKIENSHIIIMGDANAHSEALFNGKSTCKRGEAWEKYVVDEQLVVSNVGDFFTFNTNKGQSIIDITVSSPTIATRIRDWKVKDYVPGSDHVGVQFALALRNGWSSTSTTPYNFRKMNWKNDFSRSN